MVQQGLQKPTSLKKKKKQFIKPKAFCGNIFLLFFVTFFVTSCTHFFYVNLCRMLVKIENNKYSIELQRFLYINLHECAQVI